MQHVSIIVPVYHGEKYIQSLIAQAEACYKYADGKIKIELLLVNDAPDEWLDERVSSESIDIVVLNTKVNRGIQGARIRGLEKSQGEYILFLDQDDRIEAQYVQSQLKAIGTADAVVCRCVHEKKLFYNAEYPFEEMMNKEYMLTEGDPIISPGQVLIRKTSVPEVWKTNIMQTNCADDFLLWLCMIGTGCNFALNQEVLFEHIVQYDNTSWDSYRMTLSEREMEKILLKNHVFTGEDVVHLQEMLSLIVKKRMQKLDRFRKMFYILNDWTLMKEKGNSIAKYLKRRGFDKIAIYGAGYLGRQLIQELKGNKNIHIQYLIDRNAAWIQGEYPIYTLEQELQHVEMIVVTLVQGEKPVVKELERKTGAIVYTIKELLMEMQEG